MNKEYRGDKSLFKGKIIKPFFLKTNLKEKGYKFSKVIFVFLEQNLASIQILSL